MDDSLGSGDEAAGDQDLRATPCDSHRRSRPPADPRSIWPAGHSGQRAPGQAAIGQMQHCQPGRGPQAASKGVMRSDRPMQRCPAQILPPSAVRAMLTCMTAQHHEPAAGTARRDAARSGCAGGDAVPRCWRSASRAGCRVAQARGSVA